jgi:plasmid maintenance system antidote protein VapI
LSIAFDTRAESWLNQQRFKLALWDAERGKKLLHVARLTAA